MGLKRIEQSEPPAGSDTSSDLSTFKSIAVSLCSTANGPEENRTPDYSAFSVFDI